MQAFATEIPVFSSDAGGTADAMKEWNCPIVVPRYDYKRWMLELVRVLMGDLPKPVDRRKAYERFHWPSVAAQFLDVYDSLGSKAA
jgi:glycosyltransferase involved in cell wall biosynthesis